jgi:signal transduction histidine kinase
MENEPNSENVRWIDRPVLFEMSLALIGGLLVGSIGFLQLRFVVGLDSIPLQNLITPFLLGSVLAATIAYFIRLSRRHLLERLKIEQASAEFHKDAQGKLADSLQAASKAREMDLAEKERQFQYAIENINIGFILWDDQQKLIRWNAQFVDFNPEFKGKLVSGMNFEQLIRINAQGPLVNLSEDKREAWIRDRVLEHKNEAESVFENQRSDGKWIRRYKKKLPDGSVIVVVTDISHFKEIDRVKSEFISTVSHELRTPLTSIKGALGIVASGVVGELTGEASSLIDIANNNSERLINLINDILDVEKLESGTLELQLRPLNFRATIEKAKSSLQGYADLYDVGMTLEHQDNRVFSIEGDEDRLIQALSNLISNAIKFSPAGDVVKIDLTANNEKMRVSITDNGPGISNEFHDRLFEKFTQEDSSDTRQKGGTGLGLSITKIIIETHNGSIGVDSTPGEGATFYFDLPLGATPDGLGM